MHSWLVLLSGLVVASCALPERDAACTDGSAELFAELDCNLCASRSCCAEATACAADAGCGELMRCFQDCAASKDAACFAQCRAAGDYDATSADALIDCAAKNCETDHCMLPERAATVCDAGQATEVFGKASCDLCIRRAVCSVAVACNENPKCAPRIDCMAHCVGGELNPACFDQCRDDGAVGTGDQQFFNGIAQECRAECAIGSDFTCVDNYSWPTTDKQRIEISARAIDRNTGNPFANIEVTACANQPPPCAEVGIPPTVNTDMNGYVTVNVPTRNGFEAPEDMRFSGFRGYIFWTDPTAAPGVWLDTILVHTRPGYRTRLADETSPFATADLLGGVFTVIASQPPPLTIDPTRGMLVGGVVDCHGSFEFFARDLVLEIEGADATTRVVYVNKDQTLPDFLATATTDSGQFVVINVPTGNPHIALRHAVTGEVVAESLVQVVADTLTVFAAWPRSK